MTISSQLLKMLPDKIKDFHGDESIEVYVDDNDSLNSCKNKGFNKCRSNLKEKLSKVELDAVKASRMFCDYENENKNASTLEIFLNIFGMDLIKEGE